MTTILPTRFKTPLKKCVDLSFLFDNLVQIKATWDNQLLIAADYKCFIKKSYLVYNRNRNGCFVIRFDDYNIYPTVHWKDFVNLVDMCQNGVKCDFDNSWFRLYRRVN